jgi:hypothetical protein
MFGWRAAGFAAALADHESAVAAVKNRLAIKIPARRGVQRRTLDRKLK